MLMILERHILSLMMSFQCRHVNLSGPGAEVSVHFSIADLNLNSEKEFQEWWGLWASLSRILRLTGRWRAVLKVLWRAVHKLSGVRQGRPRCVIASVGGSFLFLTQFINSQGPWLLFAISWILLSKKDRLAILTVNLNSFQFSQLLVDLYVSKAWLQDSVHHCLECLVILDFLAFFVHDCSMIDPSWLINHSSFSELSIFDISRDLKLEIMSLMNASFRSLLGGMVKFNEWTTSSKIGMLIERGAWLEDNCDPERMVWLFSSTDPCLRNIKSITELDSPVVSENLVGPGLVGDDNARSNESTIIIRSSLMEEWNWKEGSHKLLQMLKSPVMIRTLLMLTSVSFRYFKAEWDEWEYTFKI